MLFRFWALWFIIQAIEVLSKFRNFPRQAVYKNKLILVCPPLVQQTDIMAVDNAPGGLLESL